MIKYFILVEHPSLGPEQTYTVLADNDSEAINKANKNWPGRVIDIVSDRNLHLIPGKFWPKRYPR